MATLATVILQNTRANQPAASAAPAGTLYGVTDEGNKIERSDGAAWQPYSPVGAGPSVTSATTEVAPNTTLVVSESLDIGAGTQFIIDGGARVEVQRGDEVDCGWIRMNADNTPSGTVNYSTLGTFDWFAPSGTTQPLNAQQASHIKPAGGWIAASHQLVLVGAPTVSTQVPGFTRATTAADDTSSGGALSGNDTMLTTGSVAGYGYRFRVPASKKRRCLVVFGKHSDCIVTWTAKLANSTYPAQSIKSSSSIAGNAVTPLIRVEFSGQGDLTFTALISTIFVGTPIIHIGDAYVYDLE